MIVQNQYQVYRYKFGFIKNELFQLVFFHNISNRNFFDDLKQAESCDLPGRYSIIKQHGRKHRDSEGKFTFALVYEELNLYNIWQQNNNPLFEIEKPGGHYFVSGYNCSDCQAKNSDWGGLVRSNHSNVLLDGCPGSGSWFYALGQTKEMEGWTTIPAIRQGVNYVSLWVKLGKNYFTDPSCPNNILYNSNSYIYSFISVFIS